MTNDAGVKRFDLNTQDVLEHWSVPDALREMIANALDEQCLTSTAAPAVTFAYPDRVRIRDWGRGLRIEHFTQNEDPEKRSQAKLVIGRFGVGLKDALATLHRHGVDVEIASRYGLFRLEDASKYGFEDIVTLHVAFSPASSLESGTEVRLRGVSRSDFELAREMFLQFREEEVLEANKYGAIVARAPGEPARIYIQGVLANEESDFMFSYDIRRLSKKMRDALNRERRSVGRSAYTDRVKAILLRATSEPVVSQLVDAVTSDSQAEEVQWVDVAQHALLQAHRLGNRLFVAPDELLRHPDIVQQAQRDGISLVSVSHSMLERLALSGEQIRTVDVYIREFNESFAYDLVEEGALAPRQRDVLMLVPQLATAVGLDPDSLPRIQITRSFGPLRSDIRGLWERSEARVVILLSQLDRPEDFARTLLHELAHWTSKAEDCTRDFESALGDFLGRAAVAASRPH